MTAFLLWALACAGSTKESDPSTGSTDSTTNSTTTTAENQVLMKTSLGDILLELDPEHAAATTDNFLSYVDEGFYDGTDGKGATIFHRVIPDFMDQGGGITETGTNKTTHDPIALEAQNGLSNLRGTIAMARTNQPDSATSQFFINTVDNTFLDATGPRDGYTVFGKVLEGLDTIDAIAAVQTDANDQPKENVVITSCTRK